MRGKSEMNIIRMAREAGFSEWAVQTPQDLERFAALVSAAERERIFAANAPVIEQVNTHIKALVELVAAERESCARVCEDHWRNNGNAMECADAIRARGEK